jgi:hypothetical protein
MLTSFLLPRDPRRHEEGRPRVDRKAGSPAPEVHRLTVRLAEPEDYEALVRLAGLDSARVPTGDVVVAELSGSIQAAAPVDGSRAIANPFVPTADLVKLLELRALQLREAGYGDPQRGSVTQLSPRVRLADSAA